MIFYKNKLDERGLNSDYLTTFHLMKDYLTSKHINRLVLYDILEDILVMALDNQQRNLKPKKFLEITNSSVMRFPAMP